MKTSELQGAALDWAVAKCEGHDMEYFQVVDAYLPSTDWAQGGPIIEREKMTVESLDTGWLATRIEHPAFSEEQGSTPLIAAMRCYVASKLGDEVEVPDDLK